MRTIRIRKSVYGVLMSNVVARVAALSCTFAATLVLARDGGPALVGTYALLHVLPGLVGTVLTCGLPVAVPYFLAGRNGHDRRLPTTIVALALGGGALGSFLWIAVAPLFGPSLFPDLSLGLVMLAGLAVLTRTITVTAKASSQGSDDLRGSNRVIFTEEFLFLPAYAVVWAVGVHAQAAVIAALLLGDTAASSLGWGRLIRRGFFHHAAAPSLSLMRRIGAYGTRAQVGGIITQLNLRLDFVILGALTSPAVLGVYAVASKFAELVRIVSMAFTYVLYPRFAKAAPVEAALQARRILPRAGLVVAGAIVPLWLVAGIVISSFYGSDFDGAIVPARIILLGLALEGVAGVVTAFLYGVGRPGLSSIAMGAGLVATVTLDIILIPRFEATGAAVASAVAYVATALALLVFFRRVERAPGAGAWTDARLSSADAG